MLASLTATESNEPDGPFKKHLGSIFHESAIAGVVMAADANANKQTDNDSFLLFILYLGLYVVCG